MITGYLHRNTGNGFLQIIQKQANLVAGATTKFDHRSAGSDPFGHVVNRCFHDALFGPGQIILRQLGDIYEQVGTAGVIEILR